jgi:hypothetical protein
MLTFIGSLSPLEFIILLIIVALTGLVFWRVLDWLRKKNP